MDAAWGPTVAKDGAMNSAWGPTDGTMDTAWGPTATFFLSKAQIVPDLLLVLVAAGSNRRTGPIGLVELLQRHVVQMPAPPWEPRHSMSVAKTLSSSGRAVHAALAVVGSSAKGTKCVCVCVCVCVCP
jgi:hypothetical protein